MTHAISGNGNRDAFVYLKLRQAFRTEKVH
jgi:hypothetical protein